MGQAKTGQTLTGLTALRGLMTTQRRGRGGVCKVLGWCPGGTLIRGKQRPHLIPSDLPFLPGHCPNHQSSTLQRDCR